MSLLRRVRNVLGMKGPQKGAGLLPVVTLALVAVGVIGLGNLPMFTTDELADAGVRLALYPLSAYRAMSKAAENVYATLRRDGTQQAVIDTMQTRDELYDVLGYHAYEDKLDQLFAEQGLSGNETDNGEENGS